MREFETGATRDDDDKLDFDGFLSPLAIEAYAEYMHKHRKQADGKLRPSDNWKRGIPQEAYMKSMWRHFFAVWRGFRSGADIREDLCALFFNVQGLLHEREKQESQVRLDKETQSENPLASKPCQICGAEAGELHAKYCYLK